ncbi:MAG: hypothetical protein GY761_10420 [Hyphomicrobiales bacterium]|nr:hypothetical protein [Hyphomicrobiales bacterium]
MKYEPFDALYWPTQLDAERRAMLIHRASFATTLMGQYRTPAFLHKLLKQFDSRAVRNCPALLNRACGALVAQRTIRLASEQFRIGQTIHISSKVL